MTDRLISENALVKDMEQRYFKGKVTLRELIDEQPTACDIDAMINKLKNLKYRREADGTYSVSATLDANDVFDIVRKGGSYEK